MMRVSRPPTLTAATAKNIQDAILRGDFAPGEPLPEADLSKRLEVSRGTVREALRLLQQQGGPIEIIPHRGAFVTKLSLERAKEIYTLRSLLEPHAVRLAMEQKAYRAPDLLELEKLIQRLEELEKEGNNSELIETDLEFHRVFTKRCNHQLLLEVVGNLQSQTLILIFNTKLYRSDMVPDSVSHRAILEGIRSGDPLAAEEIVRKHIIDAGTSLVKRMEEVNREDSPADRGREPMLDAGRFEHRAQPGI
jgi:DNA-binding GntR family transcriptional regulator